MNGFAHQSVMVREVLDALAPRAGGVYGDATVGGGGHAEAILDACAPSGRLLGIDRDPRAIAAAKTRLARFGSRAVLSQGRMSELPRLLAAQGVESLDGLLADLGVSSPQLDSPERGFAFSTCGPLDMRMDPTSGVTALEWIVDASEQELADAIYQFGEERRSRAIARSIKRASSEGALNTTTDLRAAVVRVTGSSRSGVDPATRTFQALRIVVNDELRELESILGELPDLLALEGVAVFICFHSLEDRAVKRVFRGTPSLRPLYKKPIRPADVESEANPRARSAKLRAARRVAEDSRS